MIDDPKSKDDQRDAKEGLKLPPTNLVTGANKQTESLNADTAASDKKPTHYVLIPLRWIGRVIYGSIQWMDKHDGFMTFVATAAIAGLTWRLWVTSDQQWRTMERQLRDSEVVQAASIEIREFRVQDFLINPSHPRVTYVLRNIGKTRADNVLPFLSYQPYDLTHGAYIEHGRTGASSKDENNGFPLAEGASDAESQTIDLTKVFLPTAWPYPPEVKATMHRLSDVLDGKYGLAISVHAPYYDVFGNFHQVRKCLFYNPASKRFEACILAEPYPEKK